MRTSTAMIRISTMMMVLSMPCYLCVSAGCGGVDGDQTPGDEAPSTPPAAATGPTIQPMADIVPSVPAAPDESEIRVHPTVQSECKGWANGANATPDPADPFAVGGTVSVSVTGSTIEVTHVDATYNCAAKLEMTAVVNPAVGGAPTKIEVEEKITNPDEQANCICPYDLSVSISGLRPGTYELEVRDDEGNVISTATVTVQGPA